MKYTITCRVLNAVFGSIMKKELTRRYSREYAKAVARKAKREYKAIVRRAPDIGDDNPLIFILLTSIAFVAWYSVVRGTLSVTEMEAVVLTAAESSSIIKSYAKRSDQTTVKYRISLAKAAAWTKQNAERYPQSWVITVEDAPAGCTAYSFSRCALWELCKREKCPEFAPVLCKIDYVMAKFGKTDLTRKSTLADGADKCDFLFTQKEKSKQ
jgi:hypothetical protein